MEILSSQISMTHEVAEYCSDNGTLTASPWAPGFVPLDTGQRRFSIEL